MRVYDPYFFDMAINKNSEIKEIQDMGNVYKKTTLDGDAENTYRKFYCNL